MEERVPHATHEHGHLDREAVDQIRECPYELPMRIPARNTNTPPTIT